MTVAQSEKPLAHEFKEFVWIFAYLWMMAASA
jgi:hypothetical protein